MYAVHAGLVAGAVLHAFDREDVLDDVEQRMKVAHRNHMGYPYNLAFTAEATSPSNGKRPVSIRKPTTPSE